MNVYVTGIGVASALGLGVDANFNALQSGKTGIERVKILPLNENILTGEVKLSNQEIIQQYKLQNQPYSRTSLLGIIAATEAWGTNTIDKEIRTGIIGATSVGGMDKTENYYQQVLEKQDADISLVMTHDSGSTTEKIASQLNISGYINTLSTACSSGANAIMLAARMIEQNLIDRVLVGGSDAMTRFTIKGFQSLMIYDNEWCKPFDENRNGLNLGEGAAFLVLESEKSIAKTKSKIYCRVAGWHNAADAFHQTASSPDGKGATLAMTNAITKAGLLPTDIDYINAHGTGTKNNDLSESTAIRNVFGENIPSFSSTKAFTGHTLAAAGAIEAVFSILALSNKVIFPNLNFKEALNETGLKPQSVFQNQDKLNVVLSNSFGFGGNNTSLIFAKN